MCKLKGILTLLQGCNSMKKLVKIHAQVFLHGYQNHPSISNKLLNFCAVSVSGSLSYALLLFHHIHNPQTSAWNSIIRGFSQTPSPLQALFYYNQMITGFQPHSPSRPDNFTFSFLLKACEKAKAHHKCREVHASIIRCGYLNDVVVCTNLVRSYAGNGLITTAQQVFDQMPHKDLVSWNSMISCYSQAGLHDQALNIYHNMQNSNVGLDEFTAVSLLSSCAHVGALDFGVRIHNFVDEKGFFMGNVFVGNALIEMYAKCGVLDGARRVFHRMPKRDVFTWNSMIVAFGVHGRGDEAITFFRHMLREGVQPNSITFLGLLGGCSHQGLIDQGIQYFRMMSSEFNVQPTIKHYGCMVDLLGRAGELDRALQVIRNSPSQDDPVLWRTLLAACKIHRNVEIGQVAMRHLIDLNALSAGDCVLLAGIYAEAKNQKGVLSMRNLIKTRGIKTTPAWSWIEVHGKVHRFVVDDKSHSDTEEIYDKLIEIICRVTLSGYVEEESMTSMQDTSEEWCGKSGSYHSEKLAIAFGLARTPDKTSLRIVKNLRVCRDCHSFTKFVSEAFGREIIVRDRVRFHHFKDGACSCKDYW